MAPSSRPPSLPCIPDIALDLDDKTHLLPELEEVLSATGESSTTLDEEADLAPSRTHSTHTQHSFRRQQRMSLPSRFSSISSNTHSTYTSATLPLSEHRFDLTCHVPALQLPASQKTLHESWTITYHHPHPRTTSQVRLFGLTLWRQFEREEGSILSVVPNPHFSQGELAATVALHQASVITHAARYQTTKKNRRLSKAQPLGEQQQQYQQGYPAGGAAAAAGVGGGGWEGTVYAADLEERIRGLDWKVQDEVYELLSDRVQSSSNAFRRREWRVVVLAAIPGGELTDAPRAFSPAESSSPGKRKGLFGGFKRWKEVAGSKTVWDPKRMPVTEYRLILRGTETKANDHGWGYYNRYSRPWRVADEKEIGEKRRWSSMSGRSDKYVDF